MRRLIENPYWLIIAGMLLAIGNILFILHNSNYKITERAYMGATFAAVSASQGRQFEIDSLTAITNACIAWNVEHSRLELEFGELP